jgi:thymidylate synthase (FAD)
MEVNLVSYSQTDGNFLIESANVMELIAFCARVSNPENQMNKDTSERLLKYLIKHKHWSPFEMVSACLEIKTTRDIARQILRHRSFSFQEFSQRYAVAQGYEKREPRMQDKSNRQNSLDTDVDEIHLEWDSLQDEVISVCNSNYNRALEMGIAKEQARALLPEGLTKSTMYVNGTLRSWIHFIELRRGVETQKEHRLIALACAEIINKVFPQQVWHKDWEW